MSHSRPHYSRYTLLRRGEPNGLTKGETIREETVNPLKVSKLQGKIYSFSPKQKLQSDKQSQYASRHTVSYVSQRDKATMIVVYNLDAQSDMYQIGRSTDAKIDFSIVDTVLAASK